MERKGMKRIAKQNLELAPPPLPSGEGLLAKQIMLNK
jgi:hypothetical protein